MCKNEIENVGVPSGLMITRVKRKKKNYNYYVYSVESIRYSIL